MNFPFREILRAWPNHMVSNFLIRGFPEAKFILKSPTEESEANFFNGSNFTPLSPSINY
jgi:hypothetical protein